MTITSGMLWQFDFGKRTLAEEIKRAVDYFSKKYGEIPNTVLVHPDMLDGTQTDLKINVETWRGIVRQHLLIGVE